MPSRFGFAAPAALTVLLAAPVAGQEPLPPQAHDRAVEQAAREALPRAVVRQLQGKVLDLQGLSSATTGRVASLNDLAADLRAAGLDVSTTGSELRVAIPDRVLFDFDKAVVRPDAEPTLRAVAAAAVKAGNRAIRIEGHTDTKGDDAYNQRLSQQRAEAVRAWLAAAQVPPGRLTAVGRGETAPVAPETTATGADDPAARQRNRRVEIVISG